MSQPFPTTHHTIAVENRNDNSSGRAVVVVVVVVTIIIVVAVEILVVLASPCEMPQRSEIVSNCPYNRKPTTITTPNPKVHPPKSSAL